MIGSILLVDATTLTALPGCVARIDEDHGDASALRLVGDKGAKLSKSPIPQSCSLIAAGRDPSAYALEFFQGYAAAGAFSIQNERLRYAVVGVLLEPRLLTGEFAETALGSLGASLLKAVPALLMVAPGPLNVGTRVGCAVAIDGQGDDAKVNAKPVFSVELGRLGDIAGRGQIPLATDKAEIDFALLEGEQAPLMLAHHAGDGDATFECPHACGSAVLHEPEDAIVIRLGGILAEDRGDLSVDFEGIRNLSDRPHGHLGGKAEAVADVTVSHLVQVELPEDRGIVPDPRKPRRSLVTARKRFRQRKRLRFRRDQLYGGNQLHALKYRDDAMSIQERRACARPAIPPRPEGRGFSRRFR